MKKFKNQLLSKDEQKAIYGGKTLSGCPSGCHAFYLADGQNRRCVTGDTDSSGSLCFGTVQNGKCCF